MTMRTRIVRLEEKRGPNDPLAAMIGRPSFEWSDAHLEEFLERHRDALVAQGYCREELTLERLALLEPMPDGTMLPSGDPLQ